MTYRVILQRKNRETGVVVELVHDPEADPDQPWETICVDHGGVCSHETRRIAQDFVSVPWEWCEDCMDQHGMQP